MAELGASAASIALAGGLGGLLNAIASHNLFLWPCWLPAPAPIRIVRPGLSVNVLMGVLAAMGAFHAFTGVTSVAASTENYVLALGAGLAVGALAARWVSNEVDKRLLRAALLKACAAPAAHPDMAAAMASAPPHAVLEAADDLAPRFRGLR